MFDKKAQKLKEENSKNLEKLLENTKKQNKDTKAVLEKIIKDAEA